jgi:chemotaxis-related protein WspB
LNHRRRAVSFSLIIVDACSARWLGVVREDISPATAAPVMLALTFQVGSDRIAVDVRRVREVIPRVRLAGVSGGPEWVAGAFIYRGRVVPVIDLHRLAGFGECPPHLSSRIILLPVPGDDPDALVGLLATQVANIRELSVPVNTQPGPPSPSLGQAVADGDTILRVLEPDRFLAFVAPPALAAVSPVGGRP